MRITFVLPHAGLAGGIRVAAIYAKWLKDRGHTVAVVSTPRRDPPLRAKVASLVKGKGWPQRRVGPGHMDGVDVEHRVIDRFRPMTDADVPDADVVIATWWETAEWMMNFSAPKGAKVHFIQHDETHQNQPTQRVEATWKFATYKIAVARWLADLGEQRFNCKPIKVVPNGVDLNQFHAPPRGKQRPSAVGVMYSHTPFKGCDISLEAYRIAARNVPNLKLIAFGQHETFTALPLPPGAKYTLRPPQDKIKDVYAACDAWLFGSRSEGFGLPILEAMACRTPVIGTPAGAAPELLADGGGVLVKPEDPVDMAVAIERICRMSDAEWKNLSDAAYATAQANTWDEAAKKFEAALVEAVETKATM
jgi:glycosyltransferase involved in cell wall biosynthesis